MHRVETPDELPVALASARREAASSFGDDTLFVEHFVDTPRHIEVQVMADSHGNVVHLGEPECSLQRRHPKVIEEAPSALLDENTRAEIGKATCDAARACGYLGAGTVEFIVSAKQPEQFFFMEMNTRLQVEHPVTELVTGVDLVEWQIRVARGEAIPLSQEEIRLRGHAVEARVYAEDPAAGFLPTGGTVGELSWPKSEGVRIDSGIRSGQVIGSDYDPRLAKVIAYADNRESALGWLERALGQAVVVIEAMKMEHTLTAQVDGVVTVEVTVGDKVSTGQVLAITFEAGVSLGIMPIYRFGTQEQKEKRLPDLVAGKALAGFGLTEPEAGSDAGGTKTTAKLEGDEWVINGSKQFITNSGTYITKLVTVTAVTGQRNNGKKEISAIIVPSGTEGFTAEPAYNKVGWNASDTHPLTFNNVRVPEENLVGERGRGFAQFLSILEEGRIAIAALACGAAQGCVDESIRYAKERTNFGSPISDY